MVLFPNCKINIGLDVLSRRDDGYHDIETLMFPVRGLCDALEIVPSRRSSFTSSGLTVDCPPESNLCYKAYNVMRSRYGIPPAHIHLHKAVPFGAGLGSGSSDAAFTIKGLDRLFGLGLSCEEMESVAAELGSDTVFFIRDIPAIASGRGEILRTVSIPELTGKRLIIVKPDVHISTAEAYSGITPSQPVIPLYERLGKDIREWREHIGNDFETHIFAAHHILAETKAALYDAGALYASMSGSGAAVYGIFDFLPENPDFPDNTFVYQEVIA